MLAMWPALPGFSIEAIELVENEYVVTARATASAANCPKCHRQSTAVHSWYQRTPHDLPSIGRVVRLFLRVRRFFCRNETCPRHVFCERLPQLIQKYARRTQRLMESLTVLAFALGGKEGERVVPKLGMPASRDTLLRLIRKQADVQFPEPRAIGVDDWALRKGQTYGTLLCDIERGTVIDLLPDREAETLAAWLRAHPTVDVVARDRSKTYAAAIAEGAPLAIQVADRWHLVSNLVDALETTLARHPNRLLGAPIEEMSADARGEALSNSGDASTVQADMLAAREVKRALRLAQYEQVVALRRQGAYIADIATQVGISTRTVDRWLANGTFPERKRRAVQATKLDPYRAYVLQRWQEGCHNIAQIQREIEQQGFDGSYSVVYAHCRDFPHMKEENPAASTLAEGLGAPRRRYSPRQAAFLFIRQPAKLSAAQKADLEAILAENPQFDCWRELAQQFMALVRERNLAGFDAWLAAVAAQGSGSLKRFASGLKSDYAEVAAALTFEWSNGPTEGHINKLKLLKRQMFGRAKLDLLRKRVLHRN